MKKIASLFLGLFFFLFSLITPIYADTSKVATAAKMTYTVNADGTTHVVANMQLTNTTASFYVTSYTLKIGYPTISNVTASDSEGVIVPIIKDTPSGKEITLNFKAIVTGLNKSLPFTLSFDTPDIASKNGMLWEVNIPGLGNQNDFQDFSVSLIVPANFGKPTFIKPESSANNLVFTKDILGKSGISITFGNEQTYAYSLQYHIENTNLFPIDTDIALPPSTNYQNVSLDSLSPKPTLVRLDNDGNWLARYHLSPSQKITVTADGLVDINLSPKEEFLSEKQRKIYLQEKSYWETSDQKIAGLAKNLKTPEAIYQYVVGHLTYDFTRIKNDQVRLGANAVLQNPTSAVCLEFTDLFIALARSAGIPAREVDGFGYTQNTIARPISLNKDVLHAWPEYYDDSRKAWIMVDPTWGNTTGGVDYFHTLDFDHVAFVIRGINSTYPIPAGGYKFNGQEDGKDVSVSVTNEHIANEPTVAMQIHLEPTQLSLFPVIGSVSLKNTGSVLFPQQPVAIAANFLTPRQQFVDMPSIPPLGEATSSFTFNKTSILTNMRDTITIALSGNVLQADVSVVPINPAIAVTGGIIFAILTFIIWKVASSSRRVSIPR